MESLRVRRMRRAQRLAAGGVIAANVAGLPRAGDEQSGGASPVGHRAENGDCHVGSVHGIERGWRIEGHAVDFIIDMAARHRGELVLATIGPVPLAVTTNLNINFLRKPEPRDLIADCTLLKVGKRLAVGEVKLLSDGMAEPVAHVTSTYSIPR